MRCVVQKGRLHLGWGCMVQRGRLHLGCVCMVQSGRLHLDVCAWSRVDGGTWGVCAWSRGDGCTCGISVRGCTAEGGHHCGCFLALDFELQPADLDFPSQCGNAALGVPSHPTRKTPDYPLLYSPQSRQHHPPPNPGPVCIDPHVNTLYCLSSMHCTALAQYTVLP